jgi:unsaturated rhamnogalacturonyl hydrolase
LTTIIPLIVSAALLVQTGPPDWSGIMSREHIRAVTDKVAEWEIVHHGEVTHDDLDWTNGALYAGMMAWAQRSGEAHYLSWLKDIGRRHGWSPGPRPFDADDQCVSQMFLDMFRITGDSTMLRPTLERAERVLANPSHATLLLDDADPKTRERWSWCDALFMAPPVYAKLSALTGDPRYMDFMVNEYHATYDLLFDSEEHLFFRDHRYFLRREANGRKVFWSRGNGWVMAGLVSLLKEIPEVDPRRQFFVSLFREMAAAIAPLQVADGYWHSSLLDPGSYPHPETSGTAFFCYALAYGVQTGLLDRHRYQPHVEMAWQALIEAVSPDGRLGWVQPIGADPKSVEASMTEVYGAGAFLLAGSEMYVLAQQGEN